MLTKIINNDDIQKIYKHENRSVIITPLLHISEFKIALHQDLIILHIKYPIFTDRCDVYNSRSISHNDGKLLIDNHVAKCRNKFYVRYNLKAEIFNNYCTLNPEVSCFTRLLNGEKSYSKTVREQNKNVDLIRIC